MDSMDRTDAPGAEDDAIRASGVDLYGQVGPATGDQLGQVRRSIAQWARGVGADEETVEAIVLATNEALSNVVGHAYPDLTGDFELRAGYEGRSGRIEVTIRDHGRAKRPTAPDIYHGRGIPLIFAMADQADIVPSTKGTWVRMSWRLSGSESPAAEQ
ncbi:ATP-binding protein [Kutzneria sp. NPDC051319]|uniref:ATP-binding protein n=1 Tax=Kutzneria sp. NPDC051319 TaxID=3155047 RepID=UPI00343E7A85